MVVLIILLSIIVLAVFGLISLKEAVNQDRNRVLWCILGCIFLFNAFIALKVSKYAKENGHDINLWSFLGVVLGVVAVISIEAGLIAENKGYNFTNWVLISTLSLFSLVVLFITCFLKPLEKKESELKTEQNI